MIPIDGQPILTAAQMRAAEARLAPTQDALYALMERAGAEVAIATRRLAGGAEVLVLCGPGNNGGDGYVAARVLRDWGHAVRVATLTAPASDLARRAAATWAGSVEPLSEAKPAPIVVDALFGTGLSRPLDGATLHHLTRLLDRATLSVAVDLPSGMASDTGTLMADIPGAAITLALGAIKPAHLLNPAASRCGTVRLLDIGMGALDSPVAVLPTLHIFAPSADDHKFTRGTVAVIAGRMPGASALAATAAARIAGYVLLLGSATDRLPHAIVRRRWSVEALADPRIDAVVIGPGLGRDDDARARLDAALACDRPLVIDGDALHLLDPSRLRDRAAPTILAPHAGEFAALFGQTPGSKIDRAIAAAQASGATVVLKGADTVIAFPDGCARVAWQSVPWLATAGTGDVLAGLIGGLLAGGNNWFMASADAVWLHTEAARLAGPAFIADDLAAALPHAIAAYLWPAP